MGQLNTKTSGRSDEPPLAGHRIKDENEALLLDKLPGRRMFSPSVLLLLAGVVVVSVRLAKAVSGRYVRYQALRGLSGPPSDSLLTGEHAL